MYHGYYSETISISHRLRNYHYRYGRWGPFLPQKSYEQQLVEDITLNVLELGIFWEVF